MDKFLIDYITSGNAWLLIGSGPSNAMGYPSWQELAAVAMNTAKLEGMGENFSRIESAINKGNYPGVFEEAKAILGGERLLEVLRNELMPSDQTDVYKLIVRWPVPVYLTTNYDDEIQKSLTALGESYISYSNSEDHMGFLTPSLKGGIFKLHGDLRSEKGLVLSSQQYKDISESESWTYWRTKMTSVFQMNRVVVIGHSLTDPNIRHVLAAAKEGAGVHQPVCWIAPDVPPHQVKEFLKQYRVRVITYDNRDGEHRNLVSCHTCNVIYNMA